MSRPPFNRRRPHFDERPRFFPPPSFEEHYHPPNAYYGPPPPRLLDHYHHPRNVPPIVRRDDRYYERNFQMMRHPHPRPDFNGYNYPRARYMGPPHSLSESNFRPQARPNSHPEQWNRPPVQWDDPRHPGDSSAFIRHSSAYPPSSSRYPEKLEVAPKRISSSSSSKGSSDSNLKQDRNSTKRKHSHSVSSKKSNGYLSDDDLEAIEPKLDVEQEIQRLKASYTQSTQHGDLYKRIMHSDSTVEGTDKLKSLYDRFESKLAKRHQDLATFNVVPPAFDNQEDDSEDNPSVNKSIVIDFEMIKNWQSKITLTRHQRIKSNTIIKKLVSNAKENELPLKKYIEQHKPAIPNFAIGKLHQYLFQNESEEGEEIDQTGELITTIRKLKAHKERLHEELWYNEPGQANDGPLCRCNTVSRSKGIRHNIYPGENNPVPCHSMKNNIGKMHHYRVTVGPAVNFMNSLPTSIEHGGNDFMFEGFSIFSHEPLDKIPLCDIIRFHIRYTIYLIEETPPENFCIRGLDLFHDYLFREVLELYDWVADSSAEYQKHDEGFCKKFRFYPRFVRSLPDNGKEILSLCKVLEYLLESDKPLVAENELDDLMKCSHNDWLDYTSKVRGMIVTFPGKRPSSLRIDQLDRYDRKPVESKSSEQLHPVDDRYPLIVHFGIRPANLSYAGDPTYQRIWRAYLKLRHLMANSPKVKLSDKQKLRERENALQQIKRTKDMQREVTVELSSIGFRRTGIFSDVCQHSMLLPVLTHHLRYHLCLRNLEERIGYRFKERKWLSHAMNHPSCQMNFGLNPDHVRNALSNCGLRLPKYGDSSIHYKYTRKRGITTLIRIMARLGQQRPVLSPIEHNERLEFLGDAVVGYFTSIHLFFMFPDLSEGALTTFRTVLVNNQHLAKLAEVQLYKLTVDHLSKLNKGHFIKWRLKLDEYMLYAHGPDLCRKADLRHAMANCFEALMGAIYMEAGLDKARELFGKFLWETVELQTVWKNLPLHQLQEEEKETDRHQIPQIPILQKLTEFENSIGVEFNHIRILAKAFTWRNVHENLLTHGHNQRLEFLGDSVCNLVASGYLFKLYPTHHEGHLTLLRATVVNGRTQSMVATELGMPNYVICNLDSEQSGGRVPEWREKNLADLLEAFVAALFIDKGLPYVEAFMKVCFFPRLKEFILTQEWNDPKSCLQQCCLTLRQEGKEPQLPTYKISNQTGPSHARKYIVSVYFKGKEIGKGNGESIQRAEREAARSALNEYNFPQLEWQRRYVAAKHDLPYKPRKHLKKIEVKTESPLSKKQKLEN